MIKQQPTIVAIRTETRETYYLSSGAVSKVDMIRARRQILIERAFTRPDHVSELRTEMLQYPTEREWQDARRAILQSLNLTAYLSDSIPRTNTEEPVPTRLGADRQSPRRRNPWATLRGWLNSLRRAG